MTNKPKPKNAVNNLLAAIQRKGPSQTEAAAPASVRQGQAPESEGSPPLHRSKAMPKGKVGKPVQFWLHDQDRQIIRELAAWLAGQGIRPTDSMVIRAALRVSKTGGELLNAYREAAQLDGRLKPPALNHTHESP